MKPSDLFQYVVASVIISLILLLLVTQLLGQPAVVFVETGSMAPTLEPNDGYLAVPAIVAGEPEVGDVILFQSQNLGGGELTTHRVEAITQEGYITKGDANPFTDQSGDEPPVSDGQIRAVALQVGGDMVVIPGLGASVGAIRSAGTLFQETVLQPIGIDAEVTTLSTWAMIAGLILFIYGTVTSATDRHQRSRARGSVFQNAVVVIAVLTLVVIIPVNISMLLPSGVYQYEIISSESPSANEQIIEVGGTSDVTYAMRNSGYLPVLVFLEPASDGVTVTEPRHYLPRRTTVETSVTMQAPDQTGSYLRFVREYRYLVVLPPSLIASLHAVHPILAIAAINAMVGGLVVAVFIATVGTDRLRFRSRNRELDLGDEIRRMLPAVLLPSARSGPKPPSGPSPRSGPRPPPEEEPSTDQPPNAQGPSATQPPAADAPGGDLARDVAEADILSDSHRAELRELVGDPPAAAGIEADSWTPQVLQRYIADAYDSNYPLNRCVKLLSEARAERNDTTTEPGQPQSADSPPERDETDHGEPDDHFDDGGFVFGNSGESDGSDADSEIDANDVDTETTASDADIEAGADAFEYSTDDGEFVFGGDDEFGDGDEFGGGDEFGESAYLSDEQFVAVHQTLQEPPAEAGVAATGWTPRAIQVYIEETYAVEYPMDRCEQLIERVPDDLRADAD